MSGFQSKSFTRERNVKVSAAAGQWAPCEILIEWGFYMNKQTNVSKAGDTLKISLSAEQAQTLYTALGHIIASGPPKKETDEEAVPF